MTAATPFVAWFEDLGRHDVARVGARTRLPRRDGPHPRRARHPRSPAGFATLAVAYRAFVAHNGLSERIAERMPLSTPERRASPRPAPELRAAFVKGRWPDAIAAEIRSSYRELCRRHGGGQVDVAVRSSATAEDLPDASFAGQQETFLNIRGEEALLDACRRCFASLFTDRAISYRRAKGFDHGLVALSVGVQKMVRSDLGASGVMFSIDTETGFDRVVLIDAAWGLGETVVQGEVDPTATWCSSRFSTIRRAPRSWRSGSAPRRSR